MAAYEPLNLVLDGFIAGIVDVLLLIRGVNLRA